MAPGWHKIQGENVGAMVDTIGFPMNLHLRSKQYSKFQMNIVKSFLMMVDKKNTIQTEDTTAVANVYHKAGTLKAIGTYTTTPNQTLTIEIYDDTFEKLLYSKDVSFELKGYHTIELDKALEVSDYAVAIKYEDSAPVEGESWEDEWITYSVDINPQESYVFMDEEWKDMSEKATISKLGIDFTPNNGCIKVMY